MCSLPSSCSPQAPCPNEEVCQLLLLRCHISSLKPDPAVLSRQGPGAGSLDINHMEPGSPNPQPPRPHPSSLITEQIFCFRKLGSSAALVFRNRLLLSSFPGPGTGPGGRRGARRPRTETASQPLTVPLSSGFNPQCLWDQCCWKGISWNKCRT